MRSSSPIFSSRAWLAVAASAALACVPPKSPSIGAHPEKTAASAPVGTDWAPGGVGYEIFVRSFQDSDGDGKGDLRGLISRLDYLNDGNPATDGDLGVDAIWLTPVFASPSYHGYDVTDYEQLNPDYGTLADFQTLITEAHRRGIKVLLDLVANHTGADHPWFIDSASSPSSGKRDWYVWSQTDPGWKQPWGGSSSWHLKNGAYFYGLFWAGMPDLNFRNPQVREEMKRIARLWLARGADGFRLDAVRYLIEDRQKGLQSDTPETHAYWKEFAAAVRAQKPDAILLGEAWTETPNIVPYIGDTSKVRGGDELPFEFDFPLSSAILQAVKAGDAAPIVRQLAVNAAAYPAGSTDVPFLTNHDMVRIGSEVTSPGSLRVAAGVLLTLPGTPFLYYGEELGMRNATTQDDEAKRTPMPWSDAPAGGFTSGRPWERLSPGWESANVARESADPASLLSHYRALLHLRKASDALRQGGLEVVSASRSASATGSPSGTGSTSGTGSASATGSSAGTGSPSATGSLVFLRRTGSQTVLVAHNLTGSPLVTDALPVQADKLEPLLLDAGASAEGARQAWKLTLPAYSTAIWQLR